MSGATGAMPCSVRGAYARLPLSPFYPSSLRSQLPRAPRYRHCNSACCTMAIARSALLLAGMIVSITAQPLYTVHVAWDATVAKLRTVPTMQVRRAQA